MSLPSSSSTACATANFPPPSPSATAPRSTTCPSPTSSTTSPATCRCTPTGRSRTRWCASATAPTRRRRSWRASRDEQEKIRRVTSIFKALARFFWFTIEFGLMRGPDGRGSRSTAAGCSARTARSRTRSTRRWCSAIPIQLEWVINQYFEIDHYQPLLFVVDSFDHLFELVGELERWMRRGQAGQRLPGRTGRQRARSPELPGGVAARSERGAA